MKKIAGYLSVAALSFTVIGCSDSASPTAPSPAAGTPSGTSSATLPSIAGVATGNANFSTLVAALSKAGLVQTFSGAGAFTVFAPTNAAFDAAAAALLGAGKSGQDLVDALDVATLTAVLQYHVVGDARNAQAVLSAPQIVMLDGNAAAVALKSGNPYIDNARITATDIQASNGIVHVIDGVLLPPSLAASANASQQTIAAIAAGNPDFSTLVAALARAGLVDTFNGQQVFTVFAPTNAAFDEAAKQLHYSNGLDLVQKLDIRTLTAVLTFHVIAGEQKAAAVVAADQLHMLSGVAADVSLRNGKAYIDDAEILSTDIMASNGVIHVLGGVMLPF
ncbi:MAG: fasciclin domain-containing protein [Vicinamibacterales bacterium]